MAHAPVARSVGPAGDHPVLASSAVVTALLALALSGLGVAGVGGAGGGMVLALVAFVLAVAARARGERWWALWLPLLTLPVLVLTAPLWV